MVFCQQNQVIIGESGTGTMDMMNALLSKGVKAKICALLMIFFLIIPGMFVFTK